MLILHHVILLVYYFYSEQYAIISLTIEKNINIVL